MHRVFVAALLTCASLPARADTLIVLNKAEATASLIEVESGKIVATVPTGHGPHEAAVSPDGKTAVVTDYGDRDKPGSTLTVIDLPAKKKLKSIELGAGARPHGIAWLGKSPRVIVTIEGKDAVAVVDVAAGKILHTIPTGQKVSHMVAVTPGEKRAFVANIESGSVSVLDLEKREHLENVPTGAGAEGIDLTPDGRQLWVTNRAADTITVLDAESLAVLATVPSAAFPIRARMTPDGRHVLVSNARSGEVAVFDVATRRRLHTIAMKREAANTDGRLFADSFGKSPVPIGIVTDPKGRFAYVAQANADRIAVIDLATFQIVRELQAGREPDGMAYSAAR